MRKDGGPVGGPGGVYRKRQPAARAEKFEVHWEDKPDEATRLARGSAESARKYLTAPAAVGTVDQALLAGLQLKWVHLRAAAHARSLLVVDEVHASDGYMTEVLHGVLRGHLALGGHALLMSATLGSTNIVGIEATRRLIETRLGEDGPRIELPSPVAGPFGSAVSTFNTDGCAQVPPHTRG